MKNDKKKHSFLVAPNTNFLKVLEAYILDEDISNYVEHFYVKKFSIKDTKLSYKIINDWSRYGLLLDIDREDNTWRKFSIIDLIWIYIVRELRSVGFSIRKILKIKDNLLFDIKGKDRYFLLDFYLSRVLSKNDVILILDQEGNGNLVDEVDYFSFRIDHKLPSSLVILNFNKICAEALNDSNLEEINNHPVYLESKIIEMLGTIFAKGENIKEVSLKTKDGKIERIDYKKTFNNPGDTMSLLREALMNNNRQEIRLKQKDGKVVFIEQIENT